jgi:hypothetical protein
MTDRRGPRFLLEVLFLVVLAAALTFAKLDALEIAGMMLLGWLIVAALEWAAWRGEPHYGSGLPPRYYVPSVNLPPAQVLEQVAAAGYPDASRDEAPTWIAPAALRAEVLGEWPVSRHVTADEENDPWEVVSLPGAPEQLDELEEIEEVEVIEVEGVEEVDVLAVAPDADPESESESEPVPVAVVQLPEPVPELTIEEPEPELDVVLQRSVQGVARYSLDPLAEPAPKRRFGRGGASEPEPALEVPARPAGTRPLPGRSNGQD